ncbi:MAG: DUF1127 domain-containing protein [Rhodospirillales bacterium]|nr:DUF1127 domain-containing protein [Rhodospirillales bacterium]
MNRNSVATCNDVNAQRNVEVITPLANQMASLPTYLVETLVTWQRRSMERTQLKNMSEHLLRDMGISREQAQKEINRPFWRS